MHLQQTLAEGANNENEENKVKKGSKSVHSYEPLCLQVERNFKLRESADKPNTDANKARKLTRPISPNLQLTVRNKLR